MIWVRTSECLLPSISNMFDQLRNTDFCPGSMKSRVSEEFCQFSWACSGGRKVWISENQSVISWLFIYNLSEGAHAMCVLLKWRYQLRSMFVLDRHGHERIDFILTFKQAIFVKYLGHPWRIVLHAIQIMNFRQVRNLWRLNESWCHWTVSVS